MQMFIDYKNASKTKSLFFTHTHAHQVGYANQQPFFSIQLLYFPFILLAPVHLLFFANQTNKTIESMYIGVMP